MWFFDKVIYTSICKFTVGLCFLATKPNKDTLWFSYGKENCNEQFNMKLFYPNFDSEVEESDGAVLQSGCD